MINCGAGASGSVVHRSLRAWLSRGVVFGSSPRLLRLVPGPLSVIFWTFPQSSPSLQTGCSMAFPTPEYSTTVFQVHLWGSTPISFLSSRRRGYTLNQSRGGGSHLSVSYLTDPSLAGTRVPVPVTGPLRSACIVIPIENSKAFCTAFTRLLAMTGSLPHRSHAH